MHVSKIWVGAAALVMMGCGAKDDTDDDPESTAAAQQAVDAAESSSGEAAMVSYTMAGAIEAGATSGEDAAAAAEASATNTLMCPDGGTVTATRAGSEVTFVFDECTGHCGWVKATGTAVVSYGVTASSVTADLSATDFKVNNVTFTVNSTATGSVSGGAHALDIDTDVTGTGPFGGKFSRSGSYSASASGGCLAQNGSWTTKIGLRNWTTTVSNYERCLYDCPKSGTITFEGKFSGLTIDITFNGATVDWSSSTGHSGTVTLAGCS